MWNWSLNWGEITPRLVIGSCPMTPHDLQQIRTDATYRQYSRATRRVPGVVEHRLRGHGVGRTGPWSGDGPLPDSRFQRGGHAAAVARGNRCPASLPGPGACTYVHCTAGLGQAPSTVLGYLTLVAGHDPEDAVQWILRGRPARCRPGKPTAAASGILSSTITGGSMRRHRLFERGVPGDSRSTGVCAGRGAQGRAGGDTSRRRNSCPSQKFHPVYRSSDFGRLNRF